MINKSTENLLTDSDDSVHGTAAQQPIIVVSKPVQPKPRSSLARNAFGNSSTTGTTSSAVSTPRQKKTVVIGKADIHQSKLHKSPLAAAPVPLPRKSITPATVIRRKYENEDEIIELSSDTTTSIKEDALKVSISHTTPFIPILSESSSDKSDVPQKNMFFARSRKNTIVETEPTASKTPRHSTSESDSYNSKNIVRSISKSVEESEEKISEIKKFENAESSDTENNTAVSSELSSDDEETENPFEIINEKGISNKGKAEDIEMKEISGAKPKKIKKLIMKQPIDSIYSYEKIIGNFLIFFKKFKIYC